LVLQVGYIDEADEEELQGGIDVEGGDAEFDAAMEEYLQDAQDSILAQGVSVKKGARALEDDVPVEGGVDVKEEAEAQRRRQVTGGPHTTRPTTSQLSLSLIHTHTLRTLTIATHIAGGGGAVGAADRLGGGGGGPRDRHLPGVPPRGTCRAPI
jgi:hypothetical protein